MRKALLGMVFFLAVCTPGSLSAAAISISVLPSNSVMQGEPALIVFNNASSTSAVKNLTFNGKAVGVFMYQGKISALIAIDLNQKPGIYELTGVFSDGQKITQDIIVLARPNVEAPLGIPAKLGGNTPAAQTKLVNTLASENLVLSRLTTNPRTLWSGNFIFPVANPVVTDPYGYTRLTGSYSIAHKGTDFRASEGTPVLAMNRGVVRLAKTFVEYGNTVIIDHGQGLMTFYMHLSKINVQAGHLVTQGQVIGLSGQTGYADMPHLHLTVRINNISIDPMKFMAFFK
jgi:murein DD-endopeptidase MepM/ murein hydrolase activator NlpD